MTVRGYDDEGRGKAEPSARVVVNGAAQLTGSDGVSHFALPAGSYRAYATKGGRVRSFTERIVVK